MDPLIEKVLGIASALAAWVALLLAFFNNRTSKQALRLAQADAQRRVPRLVPYLIDSVAYRPDNASRVIDVALSLSNPSDTANTVARAELAITHVVRDHTVAQLLIPAATSPDHATESVLNVPVRIEAHATLAGQLRFRVPPGLVEFTQVRQYAVQLTDTQGATVSLEIGILRDGIRTNS